MDIGINNKYIYVYTYICVCIYIYIYMHIAIRSKKIVFSIDDTYCLGIDE